MRRLGRAFVVCVVAVAACAQPQRHTVEIRGFEFHPAMVSAAIGDTVEFINRDVVPHTATSEDGSWDSGTIGSGARWQFVVTGDGAQYLCALHPAMRARIVVR